MLSINSEKNSTSDFKTFNFSSVSSMPNIDIEEKYEQYKSQWEKESEYISSTHNMENNPSYLNIIDLGERVLPYIINDLKVEDPDHWFKALESITQENPVPESDYGDTIKMAKHWISWARRNNVG